MSRGRSGRRVAAQCADEKADAAGAAMAVPDGTRAGTECVARKWLGPGPSEQPPSVGNISHWTASVRPGGSEVAPERIRDSRLSESYAF